MYSAVLQVIERVRLKAATFGQDIGTPAQSTAQHNGHASTNGTSHANGATATQPRFKVSPDVVAAVYEQWVMPLTKEVEVQYLLRRLEHS
jgi:chorismate mutase